MMLWKLCQIPGMILKLMQQTLKMLWWLLIDFQTMMMVSFIIFLESPRKSHIMGFTYPPTVGDFLKLCANWIFKIYSFIKNVIFFKNYFSTFTTNILLNLTEPVGRVSRATP